MDEPTARLAIYWRPGCFFCNDLFRQLDAAGVEAECYNIWEDEDARLFVREHNHGCETVPTVAWQDQLLVNPQPQALIESLRRAGLAPPAL